MTDKPEIEVGQRWNTRGGKLVRVLHIEEDGDSAEVSAYPITVRGSDNPYSVDPGGRSGFSLSPDDLISLAPQTIKREVALYRDDAYICVMDAMQDTGGMHRISHTVLVEFTILPGESA